MILNRVISWETILSFTDDRRGLTIEIGVHRNMPFIGNCGDISPTAGDEPMWLFLRKCLKECMDTHDECKAKQDPNWYPEKLLYLPLSEGDETPLRVIETKDHHPSSRYITLSHCWGELRPLCATSENLDQRRSGIRWEELPKTYQDCVTVARELGIQYIWIDSLCIVQDIKPDWARNSQCMDQIYENALFTVGAVSSEDSSVPFLGPEAESDRHTWQSVSIDSSEFTGYPSQVKARKYDPLLLSSFVRGHLEDRAWAWQERYLSQRMIDFTQEEARWQCKLAKTCECVGSMNTNNSRSISEEGGKTLRQWRSIVSSYSERHLTYATDRLPALSGAASRFHAVLQSEYLAGSWLSDFPRCLAWYRREISDSPSGKPIMWRSLDNDIPSWSWASVATETLWVWDTDLRSPSVRQQECDISLDNPIELIHVNCKPSTENVFGEVLPGGYIELRGKVVEAEMESDIHGCALVRRKHFRPQFVTQDCHIIDRMATEVENKLEGFTASIGSRLGLAKSTTLRRALPSDRLHTECEGRRSKGVVSCLLLFTGKGEEKSQACVLILGKQPGHHNGASSYYQRLGIGNGPTGYSGPIYSGREDWDTWKDWERLENWESWEDWFADAKVHTLRIV